MKNYTTRSFGSRARALIAFAAAFPLLSGSSLFGQAATPAGSEEPTKLEAFSVVGSRIKRLDAETPSPTVRITAADLQATGFTNVDDALRAMPFNNGAAIVGDGSGTGFASGTSTLNLRGLGNNNTLILINGRRAVPSGSGAFNGFQSVIDLRQIPTAAIESLEILKDGASAIYGSDAVAGVVNISLKRNFSGVGIDLSYGNTMDTDSHEVTAFLIAGATSGKTSIVTTVDYRSRAALMNRDFDWSNNADMRANKTGTGQIETDPTTGLVTGVDLRSGFGFPSRFFIPNTATQNAFLNPTTDPNPTSAVAISRATGAGFYNFQQVSSLTPEEEQRGFGVYMKHEFSDKIYGFTDIFFKRIETINYSAAAPFTTTDRGGSPLNGRLVVPRNSPFNPYGDRYFGAAGQSIELNSFRVVNAGPRIVDTTSDYPRYLAGIGGTLPNEWSWEAAYMYAQGSFNNASPGTAFDNRVQEALNGLNIGGQLLFANPFGVEDPRVTDHYIGNNPTSTKFTANLYDVSTSGTLFDLPAGEVGAAVGLEFRTESISDVRTLENENGNVVGGSEGFGFEGKRNVTSAYAELSIPLLKNDRLGTAEAQLAARYEDYSDFGTTTKPKVAVSWKPTKWLMMRASYSESFKAPDLAFLYTRGSVSFTANQIFDPRRPDVPSAQIKTLGRGNPGLQPEETETTFLGVVFEIPKGPLKGLSFDVSYFSFDQTNLITRDGAAFTLANELILPAGRVVRRALTPAEVAAGIAVGTIDFVATDWINANKVENSGWDFGMAYMYRTKDWGSFRVGAYATYYEDFSRTTISSLGVQTIIDQDGRDSFPLWRGNATLSWNRGDWSASVFIRYIGGYPAEFLTGLGTEPDTQYQWTINPQVSWNAPWKTRVTVGIRNVLNDPPPRYLSSQFGYNGGTNPVEPAFWYVRASREF